MKKKETSDKTGTELLIDAIRAGDLAAVNELVANGADVDEAPQEDSPLGVAVELGNHALVAVLLGAGADASNGGLSVPLATAANRGDAALVKTLLNAGANVNAQEENGWTALMAAAHGGHPAVVQLLLDAQADATVVDEEGQSALLLAQEHPAIVKLLEPRSAQQKATNVEAKEDPGTARRDHASRPTAPALDALSKAAGDGDAAAVTMLLDAGASPDATDAEQRTPLFMAVSRQRREIVALLLKAKADPSKPIGHDSGTDVRHGGRAMPCPSCKKPFIAMVWQRECPACEHRFDGRETYSAVPGDLNMIFTWSSAWTPLMAAARLNDTELATLLLDAGAKVDAGRSDMTPLMCACAFGHIEMARLLIERGAKVNAICKDTNLRAVKKITAAHVARATGNLQLIELLWSAGATADKQDAIRIVMAAQNGDLQRLESLLKAGVDANSLDPITLDTPMEAAARAGQPEAVRTLLAAGVSVQPAKRAMPPLLTACMAIHAGVIQKTLAPADVARYVQTIKLLLDAGAPVKSLVFGLSPLGMAQEAKCQPVIDLLESALATQGAAKTMEKKKAKK